MAAGRWLRRVCVLQAILGAYAAYSPIRDYSGSTFFDHWTFFDQTDAGLTNGDVQFLGQSAATSQRLAFTNGAGNTIIKVDNSSTVVWPNKRNSIRLEGNEAYGVGSLIIIDIVHMPFGCSVWPAFWTRGTNGKWPDVGEIDIIEGVNRRTFNQMALHTTPGCVQAANATQTGKSTITDCSTQQGVPGCVVQEQKPASYGTAFNAAGGGVFATQIDVSGIFIWFFSRPDLPENLRSATASSSLDTSSWGTPSAAWPSSSCKIEDHFTPQQIILDLTLCGDFATPVYNQTCPPPTKNCYEDNVLGDGSNYNEAYFEIPYIRVYNADAAATPTTVSSGSAPTFSGTSGPGSGGAAGSGNSTSDTSGGNTNNNSALPHSLPSGSLIFTVLALVGAASSVFVL
ncbi:hypothetical protein CCMSSC00406_0001349 [Pleurotus cornucopiae]|uniref:Uncharacterized protein n=1 Tax=Pleurotus cornucopiae TaxID=5321 RepID=A0ACB7IK02_PLECO|nr:hypothetical protein CCMSSC00406_0001349 [Pleurotus cornucopiae]